MFRACDQSRHFRTRTTPRWWLLAILASLAVLGSAYAQSNPPLHYYDFAIGKTGPAPQSIIRNHTVIPCTSTATGIWDAIKVLDEDPANSNNVVLIYSGFTVPKSEQYNGHTGTWDREHLWPQSYGIVALSVNSRAKSAKEDFILFHLDLGIARLQTTGPS